MSDEIRYQYSALQTGISEMQQVTSQIRAQVEALRSDTARVQQTWDAQASQTYNSLSQRISQDFDNMSLMLSQVSQATDDGQNDMKATDGKLAGTF